MGGGSSVVQRMYSSGAVRDFLPVAEEGAYKRYGGDRAKMQEHMNERYRFILGRERAMASGRWTLPEAEQAKIQDVWQMRTNEEIEEGIKARKAEAARLRGEGPKRTTDPELGKQEGYVFIGKPGEAERAAAIIAAQNAERAAIIAAENADRATVEQYGLPTSPSTEVKTGEMPQMEERGISEEPEYGTAPIQETETIGETPTVALQDGMEEAPRQSVGEMRRRIGERQGMATPISNMPSSYSFGNLPFISGTPASSIKQRRGLARRKNAYQIGSGGYGGQFRRKNPWNV
jgi:hypothetical protein